MDMDEAGMPEVSSDCGCCAQAILPLLPFCSGKEALSIAPGDCPYDCKGPVAYALCGEGCYTSCACDLPAGYAAVPGGFVSYDAGTDGAGDADGTAGDDARGDAREAGDG
jgi:hypothetical protein